MRRTVTEVERRVVSLGVVASTVGAMVLSVTGRPVIGMALFVLTAILFAAQWALGHLE